MFNKWNEENKIKILVYREIFSFLLDLLWFIECISIDWFLES